MFLEILTFGKTRYNCICSSSNGAFYVIIYSNYLNCSGKLIKYASGEFFTFKYIRLRCTGVHWGAPRRTFKKWVALTGDCGAFFPRAYML